MGEPRAFLPPPTADHQSRDATDVREAVYMCGVFALCVWDYGWAFCMCVTVGVKKAEMENYECLAHI